MTDEEIDRLVSAPSEALSVELKWWLDLSVEEMKAKVAQALIALRNNDGGLLIFGFDDKSVTPIINSRPNNVESDYRGDVIQTIVHDFCLPPFEIRLRFGKRDGRTYPVVEVPSGVKAPVITRRSGGKLRERAVYVRSIHNGIIESTEPRSREDWDRLFGICFDNREADIGRFLQRHGAKLVDAFRATIGNREANASSHQISKLSETPQSVMERGRTQFLIRAAEENKAGKIVVSERKGWREVSAIVSGEVKDLPLAQLLNEIFPHHPRLTGWPIWLDSRSLKETSRPYVSGKGWESLMVLSASYTQHAEPGIDFWRIEQGGRFYSREVFEDDIEERLINSRGKLLDFVLVIARAAEALGTAIALARAIAANPDDASLTVGFQWTGLKGRNLASWVEPGRSIFSAIESNDDRAYVELNVPLATPLNQLTHYVAQVVEAPFEKFGFRVDLGVLRGISDKILLRR